MLSFRAFFVGPVLLVSVFLGLGCGSDSDTLLLEGSIDEMVAEYEYDMNCDCYVIANAPSLPQLERKASLGGTPIPAMSGFEDAYAHGEYWTLIEIDEKVFILEDVDGWLFEYKILSGSKEDFLSGGSVSGDLTEESMEDLKAHLVDDVEAEFKGYLDGPVELVLAYEPGWRCTISTQRIIEHGPNMTAKIHVPLTHEVAEEIREEYGLK